MRAYELMVIYDGDLTDAEADEAHETSMNSLKAAGGSPLTVNKWGRRKFAYQINHKSEGYYVIVEFSARDADLTQFERTLRLADTVVRHKVLRLPDSEATKRGLFELTATAPED